jgi:hypothetical protein
MALALTVGAPAHPVQAAAYTISDEASCEAFFIAIEATGSSDPYICSIREGTLPAGSTLTVEGTYTLGPQNSSDGATDFTNQGTVNINSSGNGFGGYYGAGIVDNSGTININAYSQNYSTINNSGTIIVNAEFYNAGTINNTGKIQVTCGGSITGRGTITGTQPEYLCATNTPTVTPTPPPGCVPSKDQPNKCVATKTPKPPKP